MTSDPVERVDDKSVRICCEVTATACCVRTDATRTNDAKNAITMEWYN